MTDSHAIPDVYFDTLDEAFQELQRRRASHENMISRVNDSRYGGYVVHSIPVDLFIDELAEPLTVTQFPGQVAYR